MIINYWSTQMIKLKDLITEKIITTSEFNTIIKKAQKETGAKDKIPSGTKRLCNEVQKAGFHKIDYRGKPGKAREPKKPMYQYYAYVQGWGHSDFKSPADWIIKGTKKDPILNWIYTNGYYSNPFTYSYLQRHVNTDMQAYQITANITPGSKDVEPGYYLTKEYFQSFDMYVDRNVEFDMAVAKVDWWLNKNKVKTR